MKHKLLNAPFSSSCMYFHSFSPITIVNIAVSYIIYIYYNKEKEALKVWENI